jgi:hypothetical protein
MQEVPRKVWLAWWAALEVKSGQGLFPSQEAAMSYVWRSLAELGGFDTTKELPDDLVYWGAEKLDTTIVFDWAQVPVPEPETSQEVAA